MAITYKVTRISEKGNNSKTCRNLSLAIKVSEEWKKDPTVKKIGIWRKELGISELIQVIEK